MTPFEFLAWAFAIALSAGTLLHFIPIDQWVSTFLQRRHTRLKELEARVSALEKQMPVARAD